MLNIKTKSIDPCILSWLTYKNSLTDRLNSHLKKPARLQRLCQHWTAPSWWDCHVLAIQKESVLHRDIIMWAEEKACWYARTILPISTYHAARSIFDRLENESLGQLIFNEPMIKRIDMLHYAVNKGSLEYFWLKKSLLDVEVLEDEYWLRLSSFVVKDAFPFFLVEILLPDLMRSID